MAYSLSYTKALLVLVFVHDKIERGETEFISAKTMSDLLSIPRPTLALIFQRLVRAGILESKEGIHGGVRFRKPIDQINLLDVLDAIESDKPLFQTGFSIKANAQRPTAVQKRITQTLNRTEQAMRQEMQQTTLAELVQR